MTHKYIFQTVLWMITFLVISYLIGQVTRANMEWYHGLSKAPFTPPDMVFPIVWSSLYLMLAGVGAGLWRKRTTPRGRFVLALFAAYMLVNWAWSFLFFAAHWITFSFYWIIFSDMLLAGVIYILCQRRHVLIALMLLPTFLWGVFAAYLNGYIMLHS